MYLQNLPHQQFYTLLLTDIDEQNILFQHPHVYAKSK